MIDGISEVHRKIQEKFTTQSIDEEVGILQKEFGITFPDDEKPLAVSLRTVGNKFSYVMYFPDLHDKLNALLEVMTPYSWGAYNITQHTYYLRENSLEKRIHELTHAYEAIRNPDGIRLQNLILDILSGNRALLQNSEITEDVMRDGCEALCAGQIFNEGLAYWVSGEVKQSRNLPLSRNQHAFQRVDSSTIANKIDQFQAISQHFIDSACEFIKAKKTASGIPDGKRVQKIYSKMSNGKGYSVSSEIGYYFVSSCIQVLQSKGLSRNDAVQLLVDHPPGLREEVYDPENYAEIVMISAKKK